MEIGLLAKGIFSNTFLSGTGEFVDFLTYFS